MIIYQGIQLVYAHVVSVLNSISSWFSGIEWSTVINELPINYTTFVSACIVLLLSMAAVGLIKKLSFLLG